MKRSRLLLASIISIYLTVGCATPPISTATFSGTSAAQHQEDHGLKVQAEIVNDKKRLKELFGVESLGNDIIVIYVQVKNLREGKTFIVQPQSFHLFENDTSNTRLEGFDTEGSLALVGALTLTPVAIVGLSKQARATVVQNNVTRREFKSATLQKSESASGFLFFQLPKRQALSGIKLRVNIPEAGTTSSEIFELNLNR